MFDTPIRGISFLIVFCIGLGLLLSEGEFGEMTRVFLITFKYILPPFVGTWLLINRRLWPEEKKKFIMESFRSAFVCSLSAMLFIPTLNRIIPPSTDVHIAGEVISIKPGRGNRPERGRETKIRMKNGEIITLSIPNALYLAATTDGFIKLKCKRGGLGLLYAGEQET